MRVFVFGIGGTGARVLRSLAMLLASGMKFNNDSLEVIPVIIDMDAHNGDTDRTRELFRDYYTIHKTFAGNAKNNSGDFFGTKIRSFNRLDTDSADGAELDMQFDFQNKNDSFSKFINFNGLSKSNQDVLELLYNDAIEDKDFPELHLNLSLGFKGNPNIGSVVFNQLISSQQFKNLEGSFNEQDRIFIISSIFGGTGSSGFPTLVKLIRQSKNPSLSKAKLGAITVMPYFNVESRDDSAINSSLFNTKTKAALSYYAEDSDLRSVNALYYIADVNRSGQLNNVEGGKEQINDSHLIELLSATAVIDFMRRDNTELVEPQCFEFGCNNDSIPFTISDLSNDTKSAFIEPLLRFAYAAQIATCFIPKLKDNTFYKPKELDLAIDMGIPNEYGKLLAFFEQFKKWAGKEMNNINHGRPFNSFTFNDAEHLNNLLIGKSFKPGLFSKGLSLNKIGELLTNFEVREPKDLPRPLKYMNMLSKTASECVNTIGQLP